MKVSIALASYNGARYIEEQLSSISAQSRLPDEVVVCDDSSKDGTLEIVRRVAAAAPFAMRVEQNPRNLGFNGNFERALSLCRGEVIFISDQDDIWYPNKIERVLETLEGRPEMLVVVNDEDIADAGAQPLGSTFLQNVRKLGYPDSDHVAGCCTAMRHELLDLLLPFPIGINYDSWIATMTGLLGVKILLDVPLQLYRRHGTNSTETVLANPKASMWTLVRHYGIADPRAEWEAQVETFKTYRRRLEERQDLACSLAGSDRVNAAFQRIDTEIWGWSRRLDLLSKPRLARFPSVLKLWRKGFYAHFRGGKSAIKDMIRV